MNNTKYYASPNIYERRTSKKKPSYVAISRNTLKMLEWRVGLSMSAKVLYMHIKHKYVGNNNGDIVLRYNEMGFMAPGTLARAFKILEANGWIEKIRQGGRYRYTNKYRLTGKYDNAFIDL